MRLAFSRHKHLLATDTRLLSRGLIRKNAKGGTGLTCESLKADLGRACVSLRCNRHIHARHRDTASSRGGGEGGAQSRRARYTACNLAICSRCSASSESPGAPVATGQGACDRADTAIKAVLAGWDHC